MSLCLKTDGISVLIITGRMIISPNLLLPGPSTLTLGVRMGVSTSSSFAYLGRGVPAEELAPRFEFFLTRCFSTTKSDPGDSIVGSWHIAPRVCHNGMEEFPLNKAGEAEGGGMSGATVVGKRRAHRLSGLAWKCRANRTKAYLEARQGRARDLREELSLHGLEKAWLGHQSRATAR
ncbi:hypothetical protein FNV43_RR21254 [Rhamnella rubrinervis]|uniref:Uncharacterized protein n=1 Tax=Rhamnella rubrinervis TaxID=2594499 RepID=A0A8K0GR97_9ROSA|nr:hypothetical protein FNV43_RR21254 [Rhamnella rubrinervis]